MQTTVDAIFEAAALVLEPEPFAMMRNTDFNEIAESDFPCLVVWSQDAAVEKREGLVLYREPWRYTVLVFRLKGTPVAVDGPPRVVTVDYGPIQALTDSLQSQLAERRFAVVDKNFFESNIVEKSILVGRLVVERALQREYRSA